MRGRPVSHRSGRVQAPQQAPRGADAGRPRREPADRRRARHRPRRCRGVRALSVEVDDGEVFGLPAAPPAPARPRCSGGWRGWRHPARARSPSMGARCRRPGPGRAASPRRPSRTPRLPTRAMRRGSRASTGSSWLRPTARPRGRAPFLPCRWAAMRGSCLTPRAPSRRTANPAASAPRRLPPPSPTAGPTASRRQGTLPLSFVKGRGMLAPPFEPPARGAVAGLGGQTTPDRLLRALCRAPRLETGTARRGRADRRRHRPGRAARRHLRRGRLAGPERHRPRRPWQLVVHRPRATATAAAWMSAPSAPPARTTAPSPTGAGPVAGPPRPPRPHPLAVEEGGSIVTATPRPGGPALIAPDGALAERKQRPPRAHRHLPRRSRPAHRPCPPLGPRSAGVGAPATARAAPRPLSPRPRPFHLSSNILGGSLPQGDGGLESPPATPKPGAPPGPATRAPMAAGGIPSPSARTTGLRPAPARISRRRSPGSSGRPASARSAARDRARPGPRPESARARVAGRDAAHLARPLADLGRIRARRVLLAVHGRASSESSALRQTRGGSTGRAETSCATGGTHRRHSPFTGRVGASCRRPARPAAVRWRVPAPPQPSCGSSPAA